MLFRASEGGGYQRWFSVANRQIRFYQVLGERCSGTNFLDTFVKSNTNLNRGYWQPWKHGFPTLAGAPADGLFIVVIRNALDWVRSMYGKPWHSAKRIRMLPFSEFIRCEWDTVVDQANFFGLQDDDTRVGSPLQYDRHPITGKNFSNILCLRNEKLSGHLGMLNRKLNLCVITHEDVIADPAGVLTALSEQFDFRIRKNISIPRGEYGWKWPGRKSEVILPPKGLSPEDREFVLAQLDWKQELMMGYSYARENSASDS